MSDELAPIPDLNENPVQPTDAPEDLRVESPEEHEQLAALYRFIKGAGQQFVVYLLRCQQPDLQADLIERFGERADGLRVAVLDIPAAPGSDFSLPVWIAGHLATLAAAPAPEGQDSAAPHAIFLTGLNNLLAGAGDAPLPAFANPEEVLKSFQEHVPLPVCLWVDDATLAALPRLAPALFVLRRGYSIFPSRPENALELARNYPQGIPTEAKERGEHFARQSNELGHILQLDTFLALDARPSPVRLRTLHYRGDVAMQLGNFLLAEESYLALKTAGETLNLGQAVVIGLQGLINAATARRDFPRAGQCLQHLIGLFDSQEPAESRNNDARAGLRQQLGQVLQELQRFDDAEVVFRDSLEIYRSGPVRPELGAALHNYALCHLRRQNKDSALALFREAVEVFSQTSEKPSLAGSAHNLGLLLQEKEELDEAQKFYRKALEIRREIGDKFGTAASLFQLGLLAETQERYGEAEQDFRRTLEIVQAAKDTPRVGAVLERLGSVLLEQEKYGESAYCRLEALKIFVALKSQEQVRRSLHNLALLWEQSQDSNLVHETSRILGLPPKQIEQTFHQSLPFRAGRN